MWRRSVRPIAELALSPATNMTDRVAVLRDKVRRAEEGGGLERRERQHREGRLTARERIDILLDEGSFEELDQLVEHRCTDFGMENQKIPGEGPRPGPSG